MIEAHREVWHRQSGETAKAYRAFTAYLALDADRGVTKVSRKLAVSRTIISRWSMRHGWVERARAYDQRMSELRLERLASSRNNLVDAQVRLALEMLDLTEKAMVRLKRKKTLSARDATQMLATAAKVTQAVFGDDQPLAVEKPKIVVVQVHKNVPRHFSREESQAAIQ